MPEIQNTITSQNTLNGVGLHTGLLTNITFKPASENSGITFVRTDLDGQPKIAANLSNFHETKRSTQLKCGLATLGTSAWAFSKLIFTIPYQLTCWYS